MMHIFHFRVGLGSVVLATVAVVGAGLAAQQTGESQRPIPLREPRAVTAKSKTQPPLKPYPAYVVEPPDLLLIEVLEALPDRPITGEHLVRPDGKVSLGFYGDLYVSGLTLPQIKEKVVLHLRETLGDEVLGLIKVDPITDLPEVDPKTKQPARIAAGESRRVFVDVIAFNSKVYYVGGEVGMPGRLPMTGRERVLDAITIAGGLNEDANHEAVVLCRKGGNGEPLKTLAIDIDEVTMGDDLSTNYPIAPGDRIIVPARADAKAGAQLDEAQRQDQSVEEGEVDRTFKRPLEKTGQADGDKTTPAKPAVETGMVRGLERRIETMERKVDLILETLKKRGR